MSRSVRMAGLLLAMALLWPWSLAAQETTENLGSVPRISQADFKKLQQSGDVMVIDVRSSEQYAAGHIAGAVSIPEADLDKHLSELKASTKPIVTYCA